MLPDNSCVYLAFFNRIAATFVPRVPLALIASISSLVSFSHASVATGTVSEEKEVSSEYASTGFALRSAAKIIKPPSV
ncbi:hypothetical protein D3C80_1950210 [compost metagenome]